MISHKDKLKSAIKSIYLKYLTKKVLRFNKPFIIILMYHGVAPKRRNNVITPEDFENGLKWLLNNRFQNYSLKELIKNKFNFSSNGFVITFDDAEKNVIRYAIPILKKYNLKAILFPSVMLLGKKYGFSWKKIPKSIISIDEIKRYNGYIIEIMEAKDIEYWLNNGFELGSHGLRHIDLSSVSLFPEILEEEIMQSKILIENMFGVKI